MRYLVTGTAGFIGYHVAARLLADGHEVHGVDCLTDYYDIRLKEARVARLMDQPGYTDHRIAIEDMDSLQVAFAEARPERVIHLAAQAGVRFSIERPDLYAQSNLVGFVNILECCRRQDVEHLLYASTSSVYGLNGKTPYSEDHATDHPVSFYAATKCADEAMAHSYSHLYGIPCTGLRFFTVYGPWGRPDMALFRFTRAMLADEAVQLYGEGGHRRDWTYVDDVVEAVVRLTDVVATAAPGWDPQLPDAGSSSAPWQIFNIGSGRPVLLTDFLEALEEALGIEARREYLPMQPGDVDVTHADVRRLEAATGYRPDTPLEEGIHRFVDWYRDYYGR